MGSVLSSVPNGGVDGLGSVVFSFSIVGLLYNVRVFWGRCMLLL